MQLVELVGDPRCNPQLCLSGITVADSYLAGRHICWSSFLCDADRVTIVPARITAAESRSRYACRDAHEYTHYIRMHLHIHFRCLHVWIC